MAGASKLLVSVLAGIVTFGVVVSVMYGRSSTGGHATASIPISESTVPGNSASPPAEQSSALDISQVPAPPNGSRQFTLTLAGQQIAISANVAPYKAKQRADGNYEPVDPPRWNTAVWIEQAGFPTAPSTGTVYVYGHACHHHICPFTAVQHDKNGYTVSTGDRIVATTATGVLTYQVCAVGSSPKSGNLQVPSCGSGVAKDLVLVTCEYESGDTSLNNIVVVATLVAAAKQ